MTYYYTYKITCLKGSLKDHYYYGQHHTENLNDGYAGSGFKIRDYYKKYGAEENVTYTKEIIEFYSNATELNEAEKILIGDKYETDEMCLNLVSGGEAHIPSSETKNKISETLKDRPLPEITKKKIKNTLTGRSRPSDVVEKIKATNKIIKNTPEQKEIARQNMLGVHKNKTWYFDETLNKRVWVDKIITD